MIVLVTLAAALSVSQQSAADFFPMTAGAKWQYEITGTEGSSLYSQEMGEVVVEDKILPAMLVKTGSKVIQTTFYDATPTGLYVTGHDPKKLFDKPQPVFLYDPKGAKWTFEGPSPYEDDPSGGMAIEGQSKMVGQRTVLGEKRDCLEVKTETKIGLTRSTATIFKQTTIYAKGIGMVEMDESIQLGKKTAKRKVKLIKFEGAKAGSW